MRSWDRLVHRMTYRRSGIPRKVLGKDADLWRAYLTENLARLLVCSWRGHVRRVRFGGAPFCGRCYVWLGGRHR